MYYCISRVATVRKDIIERTTFLKRLHSVLLDQRAKSEKIAGKKMTCASFSVLPYCTKRIPRRTRTSLCKFADEKASNDFSLSVSVRVCVSVSVSVSVCVRVSVSVRSSQWRLALAA